MGTLTGNDTRLPGYCDHKLPTSCRLTSIPECCACADERAHSAAYSTYIDGIGYVQRGTRWQRYCWFCKEFWENRVHASGLRPGQTRIPETPDQTVFLKKWYEFHQGYRIEVDQNGEEQRIEVFGEPFKDVSPGELPRTAEELAQGRRDVIIQQVDEQAAVQQQAGSQQSLDTALDDLFAQAVQEEVEPETQPSARQAPTARNVHAQAMAPLPRSAVMDTEREQRRVATLRRELVRMRNGIERVISGLRELGETVSDQEFASNGLQRLGRTIDDIAGTRASERVVLQDTSADHSSSTVLPVQQRVEEARARLNEALTMQQQATEEMRNAEEEVRLTQRRLEHLRREQRSTENYTRVFGTREEMQAQGENYESPIGGMFNRAWERFRAAEEVRQEERTLRRVLADEEAAGDEEAVRRLQQLHLADRDVWNVPRLDQTAEVGLQHQDTGNTTQLMEMARDEMFSGQHASLTSEDTLEHGRTEHEDALNTYYARLRQQGWDQTRDPDQEQSFPQTMLAAHPSRDSNDTRNPVLIAELDDTSSDRALPVPTAIREVHSSVYEPSGQNLVQDARHVASRLLADDGGMLTDGVLARMPDVLGYARRVARSDHTADEGFLSQALQNDNIVWSTGLPAERSRRARDNGQPMLITANVLSEVVHEKQQNIEAMAEAFQMSAEVRRSGPSSRPEQLRMLYRLQRGERNAEDRDVLWRMLTRPASVVVARRVLQAQAYGATSAEAEQLANLRERRQQASRAGQHTRQELQEMRQASSALALAAGRTAMQTGSEGVLQRLLDMHNEMREDARAMRDSDESRISLPGQWPRPRQRRSSTSESENEEDRPSALDLPNTGRPEAKSDEAMTIKMECKICFSQVADVACLPCGHLVMCKWCSDQHSPCHSQDRTRPRRAAACPACRKQIRQKVQVYCV